MLMHIHDVVKASHLCVNTWEKASRDTVGGYFQYFQNLTGLNKSSVGRLMYTNIHEIQTLNNKSEVCLYKNSS